MSGIFWAFTLSIVSGRGARAAELEISPGDDWCAAVNAASPGDTITLAEGDHPGVCWISASGAEGAPITVRGEGARVVYEGSSSNVVDVAASHLVLSGLSFGPTSADIDAVKIRSGDDITITGDTFDAVGGISVSANSADTSGLVISDNTFTDLQATGIYLGCHDGSCVSADFLIEGNRFDGVSSAGVGYGMETKLNSYGTIRENTISDAQGPAVEVYGSTEGEITVVERNLLIGSRNNATLEIGGGPALVRNNVVIGGAGAALSVYDYGGRGLVSGITVQGNTLWGVGGDAVSLTGWEAGAELRFDDNALGRDDGGTAAPDEIAGVSMVGNVDCGSGASCWVDAEGWDLWPLAGGALVGAAVETEPALAEDWCGRVRSDPPTVGALEPGLGGELAFSAGATAAALCPEDGGEGDSGDSGAPDSAADQDTGAPSDKGEPGCGCTSADGGSGGALALLGMLALARASRPASARRGARVG